MTKPLRLGIAGLGTVGVGVIKIIQNKLSLLEVRTGKQILISAVTAKSKTKDRGIDLSPYQWERDPASLCLLYTSPSPRDRTRSRMPSSA